MEYAIGFILALLTGLLARIVGFDKDKSFYPVILILIAAFYIVFAAVDGGAIVVTAESFSASLFFGIAIFGFFKSLWIIAGGLFIHGGFDLLHNRLIINAGVPDWWPGLCFAYDILLGMWLVWSLKWRSQTSSSSRE